MKVIGLHHQGATAVGTRNTLFIVLNFSSRIKQDYQIYSNLTHTVQWKKELLSIWILHFGE
jgi:hypothetical protein